MVAMKTIAIRWAIAGAILGMLKELVLVPAMRPGMVDAADLGARTLGGIVGGAIMWALIGVIGTKLVRYFRGTKQS